VHGKTAVRGVGRTAWQRRPSPCRARVVRRLRPPAPPAAQAWQGPRAQPPCRSRPPAALPGRRARPARWTQRHPPARRAAPPRAAAPPPLQPPPLLAGFPPPPRLPPLPPPPPHARARPRCSAAAPRARPGAGRSPRQQGATNRRRCLRVGRVREKESCGAPLLGARLFLRLARALLGALALLALLQLRLEGAKARQERLESQGCCARGAAARCVAPDRAACPATRLGRGSGRLVAPPLAAAAAARRAVAATAGLGTTCRRPPAVAAAALPARGVARRRRRRRAAAERDGSRQRGGNRRRHGHAGPGDRQATRHRRQRRQQRGNGSRRPPRLPPHGPRPVPQRPPDRTRARFETGPSRATWQRAQSARRPS